ncbi:LCP family protein [Haloactinopolyspora alba]|uniref:LCP family protein n=1 Tax=Haloactinopolyspora alba TaxID=648780 RepID=UPI000D0C9DA7|nr:LCP family protein [Haloactinopolyspora alba]
MDNARGGSGARRSRLNSRRRQRNERYGRFIGLTALGTLLPGSGLVAAGRRRLGTFILILLGLALVVALAVVVLVPQSRLASYAGDRQMMLLLGGGLAILAAVWMLIALGTHRSLEPDGLSPGRRFGGALVVVLAASLVVAPMALGSRYAFTQRDLIGSISSGGESHTTPEIDEKDPWADKPRLNVLFLGGDAGDGREGLRPDTQIVASIDTDTGETTMISLPRNLENVPFPEDSPLHEVYPDGFQGPGDQLEWMLNAVYRNVPNAHPEVFKGVEHPGADANKWAVEGALGIDIDYFMLVDLAGFEAVVDALGGITLDVPHDIPIGNKTLPNGECSEPRGYVEAGENRHLDGDEALWFARSRCPGDDYVRMARQRCVMDAIVAQVKPTTLISRYQKLANTAGDIITTDVPEGMFPALIELMLKVQNASLESLTLDREFFESMGTTSGDPDYDALHERVDEILNGSSGQSSPGESPTGSGENTSETDDTTEAAERTSGDGAGTITQVSERTSDTGSEDGSGDGGEAEADEPVDAGKVC